jgi:hypothetical protein
MVYRFLTDVVVPTTGIALTHGIGLTPDEFWIAKRNVSAAWFSTVPADATFVYVTASSAATVTVFARNSLAIME